MSSIPIYVPVSTALEGQYDDSAIQARISAVEAENQNQQSNIDNFANTLNPADNAISNIGVANDNTINIGSETTIVNIPGITLSQEVKFNETTLTGSATPNIVTLPTTDDTLVGRNTNDTLTNKTLRNSSNNISANSLRNGTTFTDLGATAPLSGQVLSYDGTNATWATPTTGGTLSGDVIGDISTNTVATVGGKTAVQISQSVDDFLNATATATNNTIVKRSATGAINLSLVNSDTVQAGSAISSYNVGTASQSGTTITGVGTTFTTNMIGGIITYADGTRIGISNFVSATVLTADTLLNVTSQSYTITFGKVHISPAGTLTVPSAGILLKSSTSQFPTVIKGGANTTLNTMILPIANGANSQALVMGAGNQLNWLQHGSATSNSTLVQRDAAGVIIGNGYTAINTLSGWTQRNYNAITVPVSNATNNALLFVSYTLPVIASHSAASFVVSIQASSTSPIRSSKIYFINVDNITTGIIKCVPNYVNGTDFAANDYDLNIEITGGVPAVVNFRITRTRGTAAMTAIAQIQMNGPATSTITTPNTLSTLTIPTAIYKGAAGSLNFNDPSDPTKILNIDTSLIATGTTRNWIIPNSDDTFVGKITTDTLTNKTIRSSTNNISANSLRNGTNFIDLTATVPTNGQVLSYNGTNAVWATPSSANAVLTGGNSFGTNLIVSALDGFDTIIKPQSWGGLRLQNTGKAILECVNFDIGYTAAASSKMSVNNIYFPIPTSTTTNNTRDLCNITMSSDGATALSINISVNGSQIAISKIYHITTGYNITSGSVLNPTYSSNASQSGQVPNNDFELIATYSGLVMTIRLRKTVGTLPATVYGTITCSCNHIVDASVNATTTNNTVYARDYNMDFAVPNYTYSKYASIGNNNTNVIKDTYALCVAETGRSGALVSVSDNVIASFKTNTYPTSGGNEGVNIHSPSGSGSTRMTSYIPFFTNSNINLTGGASINGIVNANNWRFEGRFVKTTPVQTVNSNVSTYSLLWDFTSEPANVSTFNSFPDGTVKFGSYTNPTQQAWYNFQNLSGKTLLLYVQWSFNLSNKNDCYFYLNKTPSGDVVAKNEFNNKTLGTRTICNLNTITPLTNSETLEWQFRVANTDSQATTNILTGNLIIYVLGAY